MTKICSVCNEEKDINEFPRSKGKYVSRCKICRNAYLKKYRENKENKIKAKEYNKQYRKENKKELREKQIAYLQTEQGKEVRKKAANKYNASDKRKDGSLKKYNNSDKRRKYCNDWCKEKRRTDENYRLRHAISASMNSYFKKSGKSTLDFIDYTMEELREHLEKQFDNNMSWDNYGTYWQIDHIIPQSIFDFTTKGQISMCWNINNLRPLSKVENPSKGNTIDENLIEEYGLNFILKNVVAREAKKRESE